MISAAKILLQQGAKNVLLKGGHTKSKNVIDVFLNKKEIRLFKNEKKLKLKILTVQVVPCQVQLLHFYHGKP